MRHSIIVLLAASGALVGCDNPRVATDGGAVDSGAADPDAGSTESCADGTQNQDETDVDCGGTCGATCTPGERCDVGGDCTTDACEGGTCRAVATCADGARNGGEADVDCGGATCAGCNVGAMCAQDSDCASETCGADGTCAAPACGDGIVGDGEDCDDGSGGAPAESPTCDADCTTAMCGDGALNASAGEECDDGNADGADACSNECVVRVPDLTVAADASFDTDTGELDGAAVPGWDGSVLQVNGLHVPAGVTLTVRGSRPLRIEAAGDATIAGAIDLSGQDGGASPGCAMAGAAGGAGGPGGGAGGNGGAFGASLDGAPGAGSGAGGGGASLVVAMFELAGGGGAGHGSPGGRAGSIRRRWVARRGPCTPA